MDFERDAPDVDIENYDTLAADYLFFIACIDRNDVPLALLGRPHRVKRERRWELSVPTRFITKRTAESALDFHRLVHRSTRNWLEKQGLLGQQTQVAITRLLEVFPDHSHRNRSKWRRLLPMLSILCHLASLDKKTRLGQIWYGNAP